jgi:hypothetical protein
MTASVTSERPGKRDRLLAGAGEAIYRQGFEATTIAATRDPAVWSQVRRWDEYDRVMSEERWTPVLIRPERIYGN